MAIWNEPKSNYVASDEVTPDIFNELAENEKYLKETQDTKITSSEVKDATINNTQSSTRTNLTATEKLKTGFGKIRKWFADLKALAFKDTVGNSDITDIAASKVTGLHTVATSGSYSELNGKPTLGNLAAKDNVYDSDISGSISGSKISGTVANSASANNANRADKLKQLDTRDINDNPGTYMSSGTGQVIEFKRNSSIGLSVGDTYSQVWTIIPWPNTTGGLPVQVANNSKGMYKRHGVSATDWSDWERCISSNELGEINGVAQLDGSGKLVSAQKPSYTKTDIGLGNVDNIKQYSSSNPPPYPVVTNGSYPNMTVGNSNKLGNRPASDYLTTDSDIPQGVTINTIKINKTMYSTDSGTQSYDLTGAMTTDEFNPSKDIFYVTAYAGNSSNYQADMGGALSYRMGSYSLVARLNSCWQNVGNMNATVRRSEVTFNENTKKFRATIFPAYRFYGGSSYSQAQQIADTQVIVDLYIVKFR